jgi:hypothetical protein
MKIALVIVGLAIAAAAPLLSQGDSMKFGTTMVLCSRLSV